MSCGTCKGGIIHGAVGIAKAVVGIDRTDPDELTRRVRACLGHPTGGPDAIPPCDQYDSGKCNACGCFVKFKTKLDSERCPLGKW